MEDKKLFKSVEVVEGYHESADEIQIVEKE